MEKILASWAKTEDCLYSVAEILEWLQTRNQELTVHIRPNSLHESNFWFYDESLGRIINQNRSFFSICGISGRAQDNSEYGQPIILQEEIGFLGILCKIVDGSLYFLMQAKIEPGNINHVQLSPTLQATKSNFTQKHGGRRPPYLDYFLHAERHRLIVDQIQSEQSSRFYKKRNRNIIVYTEEEVEILPSHRWMTLGQIKQLMRYNNLVNMDTRTVLSCIPMSLTDDVQGGLRRYFRDQSLYNSIFLRSSSKLSEIYHFVNDYKMFHAPAPQLVRLDELHNWEVDDFGIRCRVPYSFSVVYYDIEVEGREVRRWTQPLFKAEGIATFGLYTAVVKGRREFLVQAQPEMGCFDGIELGPTVQREAVCMHIPNAIDRAFVEQYERKENILYDVLLSEEGGRFYHEQNRNIILETEWFAPPKGYFWTDYWTLNLLTQVNNCLNIQLRNLLSLLEV